MRSGFCSCIANACEHRAPPFTSTSTQRRRRPNKAPSPSSSSLSCYIRHLRVVQARLRTSHLASLHPTPLTGKLSLSSSPSQDLTTHDSAHHHHGPILYASASAAPDSRRCARDREKSRRGPVLSRASSRSRSSMLDRRASSVPVLFLDAPATIVKLNPRLSSVFPHTQGNL